MNALTIDATGTPQSETAGQDADEVFHVEHPRGRTGQPVELARYSVADGGDRVLYGQRIDGVVRVVDRPVGSGRSYLVERELEQDGPGSYAALTAMIDDYLGQARKLDAIPMGSSVLRRHLEALVA
jgi:hypothetical protein